MKEMNERLSTPEIAEEKDLEVKMEDRPEFRSKLLRVRWRWLALFFMCFYICGGYYSFDNPAELEVELEKAFHLSQTKYSLLYSLYSLPNMVLPVVGGVVCDRVGYDKGLLLTSLLVTCGQTLASYGGFTYSFNTILLGRVVFGIGAETLWVIQAAYISNWFFDQEISLAMGLSGALPNFFSVLSGFTVPAIYEKDGFGAAFGVGALLCLLSFILSVLMIAIDKKAKAHDDQLRHNMKYLELEQTQASLADDVALEEGEPVKCSDIKQLEFGFWVFCLDCLLTYSMLFTSILVGTNLHQHKFSFNNKAAGVIITLPYLISGALMAPLGILADKKGQRMTMIYVAGVLNLAGHLIYLVHPECERCSTSVLPFILYGFVFTFYAVVMWGCIPFLVKPANIGTAYGILTSMQNFGTTVLPMIISGIHDQTDGFFWVEFAFAVLALVSLGLKYSLHRWDTRKRNGILQSRTPAHEFSKYLAAQ